MTLLIPPGYLHAVYEFSFTGDAEPMVTTCGHEIDTASGASGDLAPNDLFNLYANNLLTGQAADVTLVGVTVYVGQDGGLPLVFTSDEPAVAGSGGADSLPPNSAVLVRKRTDSAGRRGRGRMYLPGVPRGQVFDTGLLNTTYVSNLQLEATAFHEALTALPGGRLYPPVVLHRSEGAGVEPAPTPITHFIVEDRIATQRRRLRP